MTAIIVNSKEKSTTIRLKDRTKKMLEAKSKGKETHEEIILRLIKLSDNLYNDGTTIIQKGNLIGTKYEQLHKTFEILLDNKKYKVVGTYNNLAPMIISKNDIDWEIDLEIVNVNKGNSWVDPSILSKYEKDKLYFICLKQILEETFDIKIYQLANIDDYNNIDKWEDVYKKFNLSKDSLNSDVKRKLR